MDVGKGGRNTITDNFIATLKTAVNNFRARVNIYSAQGKALVSGFWRKGRVEVLFIGTGIVFVVFLIIVFWCRLDDAAQTSLNDVVRTGLLGLGGLGALYGLILGARRTNNAQEQLFNERLGRGVEALANKSMTQKVYGVRILGDLAKTSNPVQVGLIISILHDHLNNRAGIKDKQDNNGKRTQKGRGEPKTRQSVELALRTILSLANEANISRDDIIFKDLDLCGLNLSGITCALPRLIFNNVIATGAQFRETTLEQPLFFGGDFTEADFSDATLNGAEFYDQTEAASGQTKLVGAKFIKAKLRGAAFQDCDLQNAKFYRADLRQATIFLSDEIQSKNPMIASKVDFFDADLRDADFTNSVLEGCNFNKAKLDRADITHANFYFMVRSALTGSENNTRKTDIRGAEGLTQKQFEQIIYKQGKPPLLFLTISPCQKTGLTSSVRTAKGGLSNQTSRGQNS